MKLAENIYFGIRIVISNGATKKMMQGGFKSAKLKEGPESSVFCSESNNASLLFNTEVNAPPIHKYEICVLCIKISEKRFSCSPREISNPCMFLFDIYLNRLCVSTVSNTTYRASIGRALQARFSRELPDTAKCISACIS